MLISTVYVDNGKFVLSGWIHESLVKIMNILIHSKGLEVFAS